MLVLEIAIFGEDLGGDCTVTTTWWNSHGGFPSKNGRLQDHEFPILEVPHFLFVGGFSINSFAKYDQEPTVPMVNSFPNLPSKRLAAPFRRREPSKNSSKLIWQEPRNRTGGSTHWGVDGFGVTNSWLVHANFTCVFYWCCFLMIENSITSEKNWKKKKKTLFGAALVRWPSCCWLLIIYAAVSAGNMVSSKIWASVRMQRMQLISEWEYI